MMSTAVLFLICSRTHATQCTGGVRAGAVAGGVPQCGGHPGAGSHRKEAAQAAVHGHLLRQAHPHLHCLRLSPLQWVGLPDQMPHLLWDSVLHILALTRTTKACQLSLSTAFSLCALESGTERVYRPFPAPCPGPRSCSVFCLSPGFMVLIACVRCAGTPGISCTTWRRATTRTWRLRTCRCWRAMYC